MDNNTKLLEQFIDASIKYGESVEEGTSRKTNRYSKIIRTIRSELKSKGELEILIPLLNHNNDNVKLSAATSLIWIMEQQSKEVLEELKTKRGLLGFEAEMFLQEWEKGNIEG